MHENCEVLNNQAIELASCGEYREAIACFMRALSLEKQNYLLWYNLGITYRDAGNMEAAKESIEKALEMRPDDDEILETLAVLCFSMGFLDEAMQYCFAGLSLNEANSHLWNTLGVVFFNMANYEDASEAFEQALTLNPYYYDALYNLRDTYTELANPIGVAECSTRMRQIKNGGAI